MVCIDPDRAKGFFLQVFLVEYAFVFTLSNRRREGKEPQKCEKASKTRVGELREKSVVHEKNKGHHVIHFLW